MFNHASIWWIRGGGSFYSCMYEGRGVSSDIKMFPKVSHKGQMFGTRYDIMKITKWTVRLEIRESDGEGALDQY